MVVLKKTDIVKKPQNDYIYPFKSRSTSLPDDAYFIGEYDFVTNQTHICLQGTEKFDLIKYILNLFKHKRPKRTEKFDLIEESADKPIVTAHVDGVETKKTYAFRPFRLNCRRCNEKRILYWGYNID